MKKFFIIILDPNAETSAIKGRIPQLGDYCSIYVNQYLLISTLPSAKAVYEKLVQDQQNPVGIVVLSTDIDKLLYWGYSDKGLWDWLNERIGIKRENI